MIHPVTNSQLPPECIEFPLRTSQAGTELAEQGCRCSAVYLIDQHGDQYAEVDSGLDAYRVQVKTFKTASEALRIPRYQAPLFYVVNVELPDMSGFDLREMLVERWPQVPGYLISDAYNPQDEVKARCSGATLYFCKPLQPGWLAAAMRTDHLPAQSGDRQQLVTHFPVTQHEEDR